MNEEYLPSLAVDARIQGPGGSCGDVGMNGLAGRERGVRLGLTPPAKVLYLNAE